MDKYEALKKYFKYDSFRLIQEEIIDSIMERKNTIVVMQTGGGKSICFQIPALLLDGVTIVITPLISLMLDQVRELKRKGIKSEYLNSTLDYFNKEIILNELINNQIKILYISPEALESNEYKKVFSKIKISLLVIDEAHTILWHMDFRESFLNIGSFINNLNYNPIIALFSATANIFTINEMERVIGKYDFNILKSSFDRKELYYGIIHSDNKMDFIINYISKHHECGIIYAQTIKDVMIIYDSLNKIFNCTYYHGGLSNSLKLKNQNDFINGKYSVMVSTIAFGLGINKKDIRYIINYNMPDSIESLAQMMGRCSRDSSYGECFVLYNDKDISLLKYFITKIDSTNKSLNEIKRVKSYKYFQLNSIIKLCNSKDCIHKAMAKYFNEEIKECVNMCSSCKKKYIF